MKIVSTAKKSLEEVHGTVDTTTKIGFWKKLLAFAGPAYLVSVGYMDPGNWATDIAGGSKFGYTLIWVLVMSNLMALLLQSLSARLGLVYGRDLAQASRETYPRAVNFFLWILAEIAIGACDLAEVLGMAIGLNLLFGLPLIIGVSITVFDTLLLLVLMNRGMRKMEAFILAMVSTIGIAFFIEIFLAKPSPLEIAGGIIPKIPNTTALYIAIGIIGATVMPHNLYLHSALVQTRKFHRSESDLKDAIKFNVIDTGIALNIALFVNASILILAASTFHKFGYHKVEDITDAHHLLEPLLGTSLAPLFFAVALIASGQSSTITGTLAGQIVMEGYLNLRIAPWLRRLITRLLAVIPALLTIIFAGESSVGDLLVLSQVILSLQLGFATIPLIHYVSDKTKMGKFTIGTWTKIAAWTAAAIIVGLNVKLVGETLSDWVLVSENKFWLYLFVVLPSAFCGIFLLYITFEPFIEKRRARRFTPPHGEALALGKMKEHIYKRIAITIGFSPVDTKTIEHAIAQGGKEAEYLLIHIVESAGAKIFGKEILDSETLSDRYSMEKYIQILQDRGYKANYQMDFGSPRKLIPKIITDFNADLLVMGAHGHRGIKDFIFGETIYAIEHRVKIPVLRVRE